ncbi:MAG: bifunctional phosphopantothenoylcysteine decarboxylase/phosphopantothenate--cysteine ligase CoaBC [Actinobacteria bacterium]|nr:bifunctional phosphopantothenoylcysteine decarboxylase/phosphopantothenate--cysteine ligase CoaBC [Actinomycetota bacterium]
MPAPRAEAGSEGPPALAHARVLLGVTGGIAAYKAALVARLLVRAGAAVDVVLTGAASRFVGAATFAGITGRPAHRDLWAELETSSDAEAPRQAPHIHVARRADAVVVAPATAHLLARLSHGLADDLLTNVLLMVTCPVLLAPAMHTEMWEHPATQANLDTLRHRGMHLVGPEEGELAGGDVGEGRMAEPEAIIAALARLLAPAGSLAGRSVVVTAGPTREHLDPVRFISNRSSGRMGFALAGEAARRGARVHLVAGPVQLPTPPGVTRHDVVSARDMHDVVLSLADDADVIVKAAAVADFRPAQAAATKLKKSAGTPDIALERNPDILAELGARRDGHGPPVLVGFAAETKDPERYGREKLADKRVDLMAVNDISAADAGFEVATNRVLVLGRDGRRVELPLGSKEEIAAHLWDEIGDLLG